MANDEVREFNNEVHTKQKMAMSAKYHKRGRGGRKYMLNDPSRISRHEWEKRNGPVHTYQFNKPIPWDEFKVLPFAVQAAFLESLLRRFNINIKMLSMMFDRKSVTVYQYMIKHHVKIYGKMIKIPSEAQEEEFKKFIGINTDVMSEEDNSSKTYEFLDFTEFRNLPIYTQNAFFKYMYMELGATNSEIATVVFNVSDWTVGKHVKDTLHDVYKYKKAKGHRMTKEQKNALKDFMLEGIDIEFIADVFSDNTVAMNKVDNDLTNNIEGSVDVNDTEHIPENTDVEEVTVVEELIKEEETNMCKTNEETTTNFSFEMGGDIDFNNFGKIIEMMIAGREVVKIRVECSVNK